MRKYILTAFLLGSIYLSSFSQNTVNDIIQRKVDSLEKLLPGTKGNERVDCLNKIAHGLLWLWDEDDPELYNKACSYTTQSYNEAKKIGYKRGIGYAYLRMIECENGRDNDNRNASSFANEENYALQALKIGEELNDNILIGTSYKHLSWVERRKSDMDKYKNYLLQAIAYFEKPLKQQPKGTYSELSFTDCSDCQGNEFTLAQLYLAQTGLQLIFNPVRVELMEKAIFYYLKSGAKSNAAGTYLDIAIVVAYFKDIETSIGYTKKAISLFHKNGDENGEFRAYIALCDSYFNLGDFENGLQYSNKSVLLAEKLARNKGTSNGKDFKLSEAYYWMGKFYSIANDFETAFAFMRKAGTYLPDNRSWILWATAMVDLHRLTGNYDSAMYYMTIANRSNKALITLSTLQVSMNQYDKALETINSIIKTVSRNNNLVNLGRLYSLAGKAFYGKNDYANALTNARTAFTLNKKTSRNLELIDNYQLLSDIFNKLGKNDSAYIYLKQYSTLKDSLINRQFYIRLNDYKKEAEEAKRIGQINLLQKNNLIREQELQHQKLLIEKNETQLALLDISNENKDQQLLIKDKSLKEQTLLKEQQLSRLSLSDNANKLKDQRLKQQAFIRNALLGGLLLFILLGGFVFRNLSLKRKNEKLAIKKSQAEFQQKVAELEMQALRAQMNPHFIFNCLNSINRFIFKNETKVASDYLTRFSRLIRMVLLHSQKKLVPLEDELEMLKLYLDMERLRFKNAFDYHITTTNAIENSSVFIPPLLLQPFCENAIWHGLMHKDGPGHLNIELNEDNGILNCIITDDGVGREKAEAFKSKSAEKEKSMGLKITTERLSLLNQGTTGGTFYEIEDVRNEQGEIAGTKVELKIRYKETVEEYV